MIESVTPSMNPVDGHASRSVGSQTLARGLEALKIVAAAPDGLTATELAHRLEVHRTIAYRMLNTLDDAGLLHRGIDSRFRGATGLLSLASAAHQALRATALPVMRGCVDRLGATIALIVREGDDAVAVAVVSPSRGVYHVAFSEGTRHALDRGAAGHTLMASLPAQPGEHPAVTSARTNGYARTFGEIEPNMYGLAVPLPAEVVGAPACLNIISVGDPGATVALEILRAAADAIAQGLA